jgi:REP element-mobilizing transposase RayT
MSRPRRLSESKYIGHVTISFTIETKDRIAPFGDDTCAAYVVDELLRCAERFDVAIPAYCIMPDHCHVLAKGTSTAAKPLTMIVRWKQQTGYWYRQQTGQFLWRPGLWDRVFRTDDDVGDNVDYILANPVRAGLVADSASYKWSGSSRMSLAELVQRCNGPRQGEWWFCPAARRDAGLS